MKEYGSNVQKLADYIVSLPDRDQRTKYSHILVELMRQIHPNMRDGLDYSKKLWDDLYVITNFDLDIDSPFPAPPKEILGKKPMQVPYNQQHLKFRYYGRNLELLVVKAMITEGFEERKAFISYLVKLMKTLYLTWNKDTVETEVCLQQILNLSGNRLSAEIEALRADGLVDASPKDGNSNRPRQPNNSVSSNNFGGGYRSNKNTRDSGGGSQFAKNRNNRKRR